MARTSVDKIIGHVLIHYGRAASNARHGVCATAVYDFREALITRCRHARLLAPDRLGHAAQTIEEAEEKFFRDLNEGPCGARG